MKILFLIPPNMAFGDFVNPPGNTKVSYKNGVEYGSLITEMPLGVISLSAYLKKHIDCDIKIIDFNVEMSKAESFDFKSYHDYFNYSIAKFKDNDFDIIGISSLFSTAYTNTIILSEICRNIFSEALILAGGNVPTVAYKDIFDDTDSIDAICYGEGDIPILNLVKSENMHNHIKLDNSWITKEKLGFGNTCFTHNFIENLDEIPFDYSLINKEDYYINPTINSYQGWTSADKSFNIMTSRGCPFKCVFCASHATHGRKMRYESIDRVKSNILSMKKNGIEVIVFQDDHFMGDKKRALEIVKFVASEKLSAFFPNSLALYALNREMLQALKDANVHQLILAVESGSDRVLKHVMRKPLKLDIVRRVAMDCREIGIYTDCNIVMGLPGETKADIEETREFLKTLKANWFRINIATPLLGSEMNDIVVENNFLEGDLKDSNYKKAIVETDDWSAEYIQDVTYDINIDVNFIHNADMDLGNYYDAIEGFNNVLHAKPDHAIAFYCLSLCYKKLNMIEESQDSEDKYNLYSTNPFWKKFIKKHNLPELIAS